MKVNPPHHTAALSIAIRTAWPSTSPKASWRLHQDQVEGQQQAAPEVAERPAA